MYYITGDTHRDFKRVQQFCERMGTTKDDVLIILGDAGINYFLDERDNEFVKNVISKLPITLFCVHGNHEARPETVEDTILEDWSNSVVMRDTRTDNLIYPFDTEIYTMCGRSVLIIGGAYSVDKYYRLKHNMRWFPDEQPTRIMKVVTEEKLNDNDWNVDIVLSHTAPLKYVPTEAFLAAVDQSKVDNSTEEWLDTIEDKLNYKKWYAGHFHIDKKIDKLQIMYKLFDEFPKLQ